MEKKNIGEHSGKVWHALRVVDKITIPELARKLDLSVESISLAVGW
ncbi:MAG: winged helix-turn-helix domain-containing protein, partial [Bacteroides sp.]